MTVIHRALMAAAVAIVATAPRPADAQDEQGFQMPSHNVFCIIEQGDGSQPTDLRCDIQQVTTKAPKPPKSCPLSWGDAFGINASSNVGYLVCHGDTTRNDALPVLAYGANWSVDGFTCQSATSGVRCVNGKGHGFQLAKAKQTVF
jgi:hypothetical protein